MTGSDPDRVSSAASPRERTTAVKWFGTWIRGPREHLDTPRRCIQLRSDAMAMWNDRTQLQMQGHYETKIHDRTGPDFELIEGITIQHPAEICPAIEATPGGSSKMAEIAEQHGVTPGTWDEVSNGWIARCDRNVAVAMALNESYRGVAR